MGLAIRGFCICGGGDPPHEGISTLPKSETNNIAVKIMNGTCARVKTRVSEENKIGGR